MSEEPYMHWEDVLRFLADRDAQIDRLKAENEQLQQQLAEAQAKADKAIAEAAELSQAIQSLMEESAGVIGYHLNGDVATWDWLLEHGWEMLRDTTSLAEEHLAKDRGRDEALLEIRDYSDNEGYANYQVDEMKRIARRALGLDLSNTTRVEHLKAALALWNYAEASARFIFGGTLGDPVADEILRALRMRASGMTRTEISGIFGRNKSGQEIGRALGVLAGQGLVRREIVETEGRPAELWYATNVVTN